MNQINSIILEGNLTKDPELKELQKGLKVCELSLACNRYTKNSKNEYAKDVDFFRCECWNSVAEYVSANAQKGQAVRVVGRLKQNRWKDKNGKEVSNIVIGCDHVEIQKSKTSKETYEASEKSEVLQQQETLSFDIPF